MRHRPRSVNRRRVVAALVALVVLICLGVVIWRATRPGDHPGAQPGTPPPTVTPTLPSGVDSAGGPSSFGSVAVGAGGWVTGMSFSDDGRTRLVATDTFGAYRWSRGRWELVTSSTTLPPRTVHPGLSGGVLAVAVAPGDASVVYMAYDNGVYRSSDGARSWRRVLSGVSTAPNDDFRTWGSRLVVDPVILTWSITARSWTGCSCLVTVGRRGSRVVGRRVPVGLRVDIERQGDAGVR